MKLSLELEIRDWLTRYVAGEISREAFEGWLVPHTWDIEQSGNPAATELVHWISLRLAEYTSGHWTEAELHTLLSELLRAQPVTFARKTLSRRSAT